MPPDALHALLAHFGPLRLQPATDWQGPIPLHPDLLRFYAEVGPAGLDIPTTVSPFWLPPLDRLWDFQAGYRWNGNTGARLTDWRDNWLVVADPFILDLATGQVLHDMHGGGSWSPVPLLPDAATMAACLGTIGAVHVEAGDDIYDADFDVRPAWKAQLRERLTPIIGAGGAAALAERFDW